MLECWQQQVNSKQELTEQVEVGVRLRPVNKILMGGEQVLVARLLLGRL